MVFCCCLSCRPICPSRNLINENCLSLFLFQEIDPKAGGGHPMTIGTMVRQLLTKLDWYDSLFPRIPVPIQVDSTQTRIICITQLYKCFFFRFKSIENWPRVSLLCKEPSNRPRPPLRAENAIGDAKNLPPDRRLLHVAKDPARGFAIEVPGTDTEATENVAITGRNRVDIATGAENEDANVVEQKINLFFPFFF